jgi:serine/threonine protein kinase
MVGIADIVDQLWRRPLTQPDSVRAVYHTHTRPLAHHLHLPLMVDDWSQAIQHDVMRIYRARRDEAHRSVSLKYTILGFISSGTYGRVYKAQSKDEDGRVHAIKKFKPDKDGDIATYTGISQSAIREIAVSMLRLSRCRL